MYGLQMCIISRCMIIRYIGDMCTTYVHAIYIRHMRRTSDYDICMDILTYVGDINCKH